MTLTTEQTQAIAAHLRGRLSPSRDAEVTEREAYRVLGRFLENNVAALGGAICDERLLHVHTTQRYHAVPSGLTWDVDLLGATTERLYWVSAVRGQVAPPQALSYDDLVLKPKMISTGKMERTPAGLELTVGKKDTTWEELRRARTAPPDSGWLADILDRRAAPPAGQWAPDPAGRHEFRWFDGAVWTPHVSDRGVAGTDPL